MRLRSLFHSIFTVTLLLASFFGFTVADAQEFEWLIENVSYDLSITSDDIWFYPASLIAGDQFRIYAGITNLGTADSLGYVNFFQGVHQIGTSQIISIRANGVKEEVFVDWVVPQGPFNIRAEVVLTGEVDEDLTNNIAITPTFYPKTDLDGDGILDDHDNCPSVSNVEQTDTDGDTIGDACDSDDDNDNSSDNNEATEGTDPLNPDTDGDTIQDGDDNCPLIQNTNQADADNDGIGDVCDATSGTDNNNDTGDNGNNNGGAEDNQDDNGGDSGGEGGNTDGGNSGDSNDNGDSGNGGSGNGPGESGSGANSGNGGGSGSGASSTGGGGDEDGAGDDGEESQRQSSNSASLFERFFESTNEASLEIGDSVNALLDYLDSLWGDDALNSDDAATTPTENQLNLILSENGGFGGEIPFRNIQVLSEGERRYTFSVQGEDIASYEEMRWNIDGETELVGDRVTYTFNDAGNKDIALQVYDKRTDDLAYETTYPYYVSHVRFYSTWIMILMAVQAFSLVMLFVFSKLHHN